MSFELTEREAHCWKDGREAERAAIVAWLRDKLTPSGFPYTNAKFFADLIESAAHHLNQGKE